MDTVYDIHQFTSCAVFYFTRDKIRYACCNTSSRISPIVTRSLHADPASSKDETYRPKNNITDNLYRIFEKGYEKRNVDDDQYLNKMARVIEKLAPITSGNKSAKHWHYAIVVPSEWEEEIRDELIPQLFIRAKLISEDDHKDRLLFFSDIECIYYYLQDSFMFEKGEQTLTSNIKIFPDNEVLIEFDLVQTINPLFEFPNSKYFPKILKSATVSITPQDFKNDIRSSLTSNIEPFKIDVDSDQIGENVIEELYNRLGFETEADEKNSSELENNAIIKKYKDASAVFNLCNGIKSEIEIVMKFMLPNNIGKDYGVLTLQDRYSVYSRPNTDLANWINIIQNCGVSFAMSHICIDSSEDDIFYINPNNIYQGAFSAALETIKHSDIYCPPRIIDRVDLGNYFPVVASTSPSVIVYIDISFESTQLSLSVLNGDGLVDRIFECNHFTSVKRLHSLNSFYTTLNEEEHVLNHMVTMPKFVNVIESILTGFFTGNKVAVHMQREYMREYLLLYMAHIIDIIVNGWPKDCASDLQIGYVVSIEKILLKNLIVSLENLQEIIYSSGLLKKNDEFKKLIVVTNVDGVLPAIQRSLELDFPLKSYFLLASLHEDYIQLTLHQVVTSSSIDEKEQESVICQDEIIVTQNLYEALCFNMWDNLNKNRHLIQLCNNHQEFKDDENMRVFLLKNKTGFVSNLKNFISQNILAKNSNLEITHGDNIRLNRTCNCKVYLTVCDVIEVSFKPVLKKIVSIVSSSLINNDFFGKYTFIEKVLILISFNHNPKFQHVLRKLIQEDALDFDEFNGIETSYTVIPKVANQLLQPIIKQQPFLYKAFQIGILRQIHSSGCCFSINIEGTTGLEFFYKNKLTDVEDLHFQGDSLFPLFGKGDIRSLTKIKRVLYFKLKEKSGSYKLSINYHECEQLVDNETIHLKYKEILGNAEVFFKADDYSTSGYLPVIVSFVSDSPSSSICVSIIYVGNVFKTVIITEVGDPMTLNRF